MTELPSAFFSVARRDGRSQCSAYFQRWQPACPAGNGVGVGVAGARSAARPNRAAPPPAIATTAAGCGRPHFGAGVCTGRADAMRSSNRSPGLTSGSRGRSRNDFVFVNVGVIVGVGVVVGVSVAVAVAVDV